MDFLLSNDFWSVIGIWFWAVIMPGADMFLVIRTALSQGKQCAYFASFGIVLGTIVWLIVGFFFIKTLKETSFFEIVQILGGGYLMFMACQILISLKNANPSSIQEQENLQKNPWKSLIYGIFTNLSNPKPPIFVSIILSKISQDLAFQSSLILLLVMTLIPMVWFCLVVRVFSIERFFNAFMRYSRWIDIVVMCVFAIFGADLIFEGVGEVLAQMG